MKYTTRVAYGGMLTGVSIVLLVFASAAPAFGWGLCICAGMVPAVALARRQVRTGVLVYAATALLAALVVPGKRYAVAYTLLFGIYPLVKYAIEHIRVLAAEWACKLAYAAALMLLLWQLVQRGLLLLNGQLGSFPIWAIAAAFLAAFVCYDIIFSKIIALFRVIFRE